MTRKRFAAASGIIMAAISATGLTAGAAELTWNGGSANFYSSNWTGGSTSTSTPNISSGADTAVISSGTTTYAGSNGDWKDNSTVTYNGTGAFAQTSNNWLKIGSGTGNVGTLQISGTGSFDVGTASGQTILGDAGATGHLKTSGSGTFKAQALVLNGVSDAALNGGATTIVNGVTVSGAGVLGIGGSAVTANAVTFSSTGTLHVTAGSLTTGTLALGSGGGMNVSGGMVTVTGNNFQNFGAGNSLQLSGSGIINFAGEVDPLASGSIVINGGSFNARLISFASVPNQYLTLSAGQINIAQGTNANGIYGTGYVDFTTGSTGVFKILNNGTDTADQMYNRVLQLISNGKLRINGATQTASAFSISSTTAGASVQLVPEPTSLAALGLLGMLGLRRRRA